MNKSTKGSPARVVRGASALSIRCAGRRRRWRRLVLGACWWGLWVWPPFPARAGPVLNEVCYDPEGADAGQEFVELYNPEVVTAALAGVRLEFANGAVGPEWQVRWTGAPGDSLAPGDFFLIADRGWMGAVAADAEVTLSLQNGPDAIRLVLPGGELDVLGYGELTDSALFEGVPQNDVPSGYSLGRRPDGHDSDDNLADWAELEIPTPGGRNFLNHAGLVDIFQCEPPSLSMPGSEVTVTLRLLNTGLQTLPGGPVSLVARTPMVTLEGYLDGLTPGQSSLLLFSWRPATNGRWQFQIELPLPAGEGSLVLPAGTYQVGITGVFLNEVMAAPAAGACEWVEIGNAGEDTLAMSQFCLRDEDGHWHALPIRPLAPGELLVLVQDRERYLRWWEELLVAGAAMPCGAQAPVLGSLELPGGWPSLNNSPPASRDFADRVYLADASGTVLDHVTLGAGGVDLPGGRSLERVAVVPRGASARNWGPATSPVGGTPACSNSLALGGKPPTSFTLRPNPIRPAVGGEVGIMHILFSLPAGAQAWDARVFDLWGRKVRDLGGDALGPGPRDVLWDGRDDDGRLVVVGAYIVLLRTFDTADRLRGGQKQLAVVGSALPR